MNIPPAAKTPWLLHPLIPMPNHVLLNLQGEKQSQKKKIRLGKEMFFFLKKKRARTELQLLGFRAQDFRGFDLVWKEIRAVEWVLPHFN